MKRPWIKHVNWTLVVTSALGLYILLYPCYIYLDSWWSSGIHRRNGMVEVDLKSMSSFELDPSSGTNADIPRSYRNLDGKRVVLIGEMWSPNVAQGKLSNFQLCYSVNQCCFNGPPKVQHFVKATIRASQCSVANGFVRVIGTLHVGLELKDGQIQSVYRVDAKTVESLRS